MQYSSGENKYNPVSKDKSPIQGERRIDRYPYQM